MAPARRRGAGRPRPSTASATGSCRRPLTAASSRRAGASSTCASARRSSSSTATRPAEVYGLLAHHFAEADEPERAVEYLLKAGDAARAAYAEEEAIELYRRALGFMERTGDEARARATLLRIALTHHLAFDFRAANEAFGQAFARPAPVPPRLEPSERVTWAWLRPGTEAVAPGTALASRRAEVIVNLFRGLVSLGRDLEIEPDLAERFTVSDDGRSYRFTLRPDARWSDGTPVTAYDFAFTYAQMAEDDVADRLPARRGQRRRRRRAARSSSGCASRETTSSTCSASRRSSPGRGTSTSARDVTGTAPSRSSGTARSSHQPRREPALCSRRPRAGTGHAGTSRR